MRLRDSTRLVAEMVRAGRELEQATAGKLVLDEAAVAAATRFGELCNAAPPAVYDVAMAALEREFPGRYRLRADSTRPPGLWTARLVMAALGVTLVVTGLLTWAGVAVPWWAMLVPLAVVVAAGRSRRFSERAAWAQRERAARQAARDRR